MAEDTATQKQSILVGIAGGSASGKTTFTAALHKTLTENEPRLVVEVVGMDKYFYRGAPGGPRFTSPTTGEELPDNNHPNSADNARLITDLEARKIAPDAPDVMIVEGLMSLHIPELREQFDLRLFIEMEADIRALRRMVRDMNGGRGSTDPHFISAYYRECARIGHAQYVEPSRAFADLIVRGDGDFERTAPLIAAVVRVQVGKR